MKSRSGPPIARPPLPADPFGHYVKPKALPDIGVEQPSKEDEEKK